MKSIQVGFILPQGWLDEFPGNNAYDQFLFSKPVALKAEQLGYMQVMSMIILFRIM